LTVRISYCCNILSIAIKLIRVFQLEKFVQKNPHQLEELANVIALLEGQVAETLDMDQMELNLQPEIHRICSIATGYRFLWS
jgi:hypothetical protein